MRYRRRKDSDWGPGSNAYEDADFPGAMSAYGQAVQGIEPDERPDFELGTWSGGGHADWACDDPQSCAIHGTGGWDGIEAPDPAVRHWDGAPAGTLAGHRGEHCMSQLPGCTGQCGG